VSAAHAVYDGAQDGFPYSYGAEEIIQSGDSGGPVEVPGASPHAIVAVNSGAGGGSEVLARVDLVFGWIKTTVEQAGSDVTPSDPSDPNNPPNPDDPSDPGGDPDFPPDDPGADPGDGCQGIDYNGACLDDGSVVWCEDGQLQGLDCASEGSWCVTIAGWSDCF
jgi:hypothetical protein